MKKIVLLSITLLVISIIYTIPVRAENFAQRTVTVASETDFSWSSIAGAAKAWEAAGGNGENYINPDSMAGLVTGLGGILTAIGVGIVFAGFLIIGIKYMMATPEEAAKLKTKLVGLAVAGIVIVGAWGIWSLAITFFNSIS